MGSILTLLKVELYFFAVYGKVFDSSICHKVFIKTAFAAIYGNIVKSEVTGACSAFGNRDVVENVAITRAVFQGDVIYARRKPVVFLLAEKIEIYEASRSPTGDIFQADEFVMLCGVVAEFEPEQIDRFVDVTVADDYVFVVYRFRAAGQHSVAVAVLAILHNDIMVFAVLW